MQNFKSVINSAVPTVKIHVHLRKICNIINHDELNVWLWTNDYSVNPFYRYDQSDSEGNTFLRIYNTSRQFMNIKCNVSP